MRLDFMDNASFKYFTDRDRYELEEITAFLGTIARNPGAVVLDVGANYGAFTLAAASALGRLELFERILAVEPDPRAFQALSRSIRLNDFGDWVVACRAIASDTSGQQTLFQNARSSADNRTHAVRTAPIRVRTVSTVRAATLDELLREHGLAAIGRYIAKMDIQGNEFRALKGMAKTLHDARGFVLFLEHFPYLIESAGVDLSEYLNFLRSLEVEAIWEIHNEGITALGDFDAFESRTRDLAQQSERHLQGAGTNMVFVKRMSFVPVAPRAPARQSTPQLG
jgi:FkbM family methyltransferase